jgi:hypothetical protein
MSMKEALIIDKNYPGVWVSEGCYYYDFTEQVPEGVSLIIDGVCGQSIGLKLLINALVIKNGGKLHVRKVTAETCLFKGKNSVVSADCDFGGLEIEANAHAWISAYNPVNVRNSFIVGKDSYFFTNKLILPESIEVNSPISVGAEQWFKDEKELNITEANAYGLRIESPTLNYVTCEVVDLNFKT